VHVDALDVAPFLSRYIMNLFPTTALSVGPNPCSRCGKPKSPGAGKRLCDDCEPVRPKRPCMRCGVEPKAPGKGSRLCLKCRGYTYESPRPCANCGERTPKARGKHLCPECETYVPEVTLRRRRAKAALKRKPCLHCKRPKGPGVARQLCDRCRDKAKQRMCQVCGTNPVRPGRCNRLCESCKQKSRRRTQLKALVRDRKRRATEASYVERARELRRQSWHRRISEPPFVATKKKGKSLPGPPLATAIRNLAIREANGTYIEHFGDGDQQFLKGRVATLCERAGIADRSIRRWETGDNVTFAMADQICQRLDLEWWNVWVLPKEKVGHGPAHLVQAYITEVEKALEAQAIFIG
jgi:hypothetical protein